MFLDLWTGEVFLPLLVFREKNCPTITRSIRLIFVLLVHLQAQISVSKCGFGFLKKLKASAPKVVLDATLPYRVARVSFNELLPVVMTW